MPGNRQDTIRRPIDNWTQSITYSATSATLPNAFPDMTCAVAIYCTTAAIVNLSRGGIPASATNGVPVAATTVTFLEAQPGDKLTAIRVSADGIVYATPCV